MSWARVSIDESIQMIVLMIVMKTTLWRFSFHFIWLTIYLFISSVCRILPFLQFGNVILEMNIISHGFTQNGSEKKNKNKT